MSLFQLKLDQVKTKLPFRVNANQAEFRVRDIVGEDPQERLDLQVFLPALGTSLQRELVWENWQKSQFILSILMGRYIPHISLIRSRDFVGLSISGAPVYQVIDGKQRLSTVMEFYSGKFEVEHEGQLYTFKDLDGAAQEAFLGYWFTATVAYEYADAKIADADKVRWFNQINFAGTPQDKAHQEMLRGCLERLEKFGH